MIGFYRIVLAEKHLDQVRSNPGVRSDGTYMQSKDGTRSFLVEVDESAREAVQKMFSHQIPWERFWIGPRPKITEAQIQEARAKLPDPSTSWADGCVVYLPGPAGSPPSQSVRVPFVRRADGSGWDFFERGVR